MTACSNNRRHGAVVAALVGAMSLGAPAVALAANGGIETLAVNWSTDAKIVRAKDNKGNVIADVENVKLAPGRYLVPVEVENSRGDRTDVSDATVKYYSDKDCTNEITDYENGFSNTGTYYLTITLDGVTSEAISFKVANPSLAGATAFEVNSYDADDVSDTTFTYNAKPQSVGFVVDGKVLTAGEDYSVKYYKSGAASTTGTEDAPTDAGSYTAVLTGENDYEGSSAQVTFTVEKLDLSTASVWMDDTTGAANANKVHVANVTDGAIDESISVSLVSNPNGGNYYDGTQGKFTVSVSAKKDDANVTGSTTVSFYKVSSLLTNCFYYGETKLSDGETLTLNKAKGQSFDASELHAVKDADEETNYSIEVTYTDTATGKTVDASALANPGTYGVDVRIVPSSDEGWVGGNVHFKVEIALGKIDADKTVAFLMDGELVTKVEKTYDGTDVLDSLTAEVKDSKGNLLEAGKDYTLVAKKDGKVVDSVLDKGEYTVEVDAPGYKLSGVSSINVSVKAVNLVRLVADVDSMKFDADKSTGEIPASATVDGESVSNEFYVAYTGSAVEVPAVTYQVEKDGKFSYVTLDPSLYNVLSIKDESGKVVKEAKEAGTYTVKIALTDKAEGNYTLTKDTFTFTIKEFGHFTDVDSAKWYSVAVEKAADNEYIHGISGTNLYMPEAKMTRADAICVLFNMAGGDSKIGDEDFQYSEDHGYVTGFSDVNGNEYFAKALAWAKASGIANGSNGEFRPYDSVSRQEFAAFLANFAKAKGAYTAPSDGALDAIEDAEGVSSWATEVVSWAVENGVMGNKGYVYATSDISRAEVAAMAVNYQPEKLA